MKKNYNFLNVMKAFSCIFVIFLHSEVSLKLPLISQIARVGVLVFLTITGFFSSNITLSKINTRLYKILKMILCVLLLYIIWNSFFYHYTNSGYYNVLLKENLNLKSLFYLIFFNRAPFICSIFYYLLIIVYVYIFDYILVKLNIRDKIIPSISFIIISISLIVQFFYNYEWFIFGNWIFTGIPFYYLGIYFKKNEEKLKNINIPLNVVLIVFGFLLVIIQYYLTNKVVYYCLGNIVFLVPIFSYACRNKNNEKTNLLSFIGENLSLYIFIVHLVFINLVNFVIKNDSNIIIIFKLLIVILISLIVSIIIYYCKEKLRYGKKKKQ